MTISAYPPSVDTFSDLIDAGIVTSESLTIPGSIPFTYQLAYVPQGPKRTVNGVVQASTVYIRDFREIEGTPQQSGQFNVDYNSGIVTFNPADKDKNIIIQYTTAGDEILALYINKLQDAVLALEEFAINPYLVAPDSTKWYLKVSNVGVLTVQNQP